ncbi:MAG: glycosyltransferase family 2 protein [Candidatus Hodarchaeota archaeon]
MIKLVSIILLNYNNNHFTVDCLKSLTKQSYKNFEIIIIDNASKYGTYLELKTILKEFESKLKIKLIRSEYNLFFAGGNSIGIKNAKGDYIFLLNNDTEVVPDFLEKIVNYLDKNKDVGMICPKILFYKDKNRIWYGGAYLNPRSIYFSYHLGINQKDNEKYDQMNEPAYACGAALITRRKIIDKVGLMDEIFFIYVEDVDWSYRAKKKGYKLIYFPDTVVYHKLDIITKKNRLGFRENPFQIYLYTRNKIIFVLKHFSFFDIFLFFCIYQLKKTIIEFIISIFQKKPDFLIAQVRALIMGFLIGFKRRFHRSCKNLMKREINYYARFQKYRN